MPAWPWQEITPVGSKHVEDMSRAPRSAGSRPVRHRDEHARARGAFRRGLALGAAGALLAGALLGGGVWLATGTSTEREARAAELRAEEAARDRAQIRDLTELAAKVVADLHPAVEEMVAAFDSAAALGQVDEASVARWEQDVRSAAERFGDPPSGQTATNVARGSLTAAVELFGHAVRTAAQRRDAAAADQARDQVDLALRVWSIGATQLDAINIEAGFGHRHVFFPLETKGGMTADPAPEGSGAHIDDSP